MYKATLFFLLAIISCSPSLIAQRDSLITIGHVDVIRSKILSEEREIIVHVPLHHSITEYGSDFLLPIVDDVFASVKIVAEDINDNWQKGLIVNFNPYKAENPGIPFMVFEIELTEDHDLGSHLDQPIYSSTGITCRDK